MSRKLDDHSDEENLLDEGPDVNVGDDHLSDDEDAESAYRDPPEGFIRIRPSRFNYIPGTVFVEYPPELG